MEADTCVLLPQHVRVGDRIKRTQLNPTADYPNFVVNDITVSKDSGLGLDCYLLIHSDRMMIPIFADEWVEVYGADKAAQRTNP